MNQEMPSFHGEDVEPSKPEDALFHVLPVPFEESVSYGAGTSAGPAATLEASCQLELLTLDVVPAEYGLYTAPPVDCSGRCEKVLANIERGVDATLGLNKIPVIIGGEHTVTCGVIPALKKHFEDFGVIQFDAHADLRNSYQGSELSHACVMRRIHEQGIPIYQLGTRSYSVEERDYRQEHDIAYRDAEDIWRNGHDLNLPDNFPEKVFITFDIDGLDSALLPATGTPVPGGLSWYQAMWLLEQIMESRVCIGFDMVEFAPIPQLHGNGFTAAQLVYNMMGYLVKSDRNRRYHNLS
ncbi:agmatinase [Desulfosediminicola ganghwensis]|uniref:agmatinase n=1 Tax=Desulfosediminicola ganghwensis TaxID=2569540 RepID=UPI0010ACF757|nr:agmatinase [Desulfosediminicola ganghwensis]